MEQAEKSFCFSAENLHQFDFADRLYWAVFLLWEPKMLREAAEEAKRGILRKMTGVCKRDLYELFRLN